MNNFQISISEGASFDLWSASDPSSLFYLPPSLIFFSMLPSELLFYQFLWNFINPLLFVPLVYWGIDWDPSPLAYLSPSIIYKVISSQPPLAYLPHPPRLLRFGDYKHSKYVMRIIFFFASLKSILNRQFTGSVASTFLQNYREGGRAFFVVYYVEKVHHVFLSSMPLIVKIGARSRLLRSSF